MALTQEQINVRDGFLAVKTSVNTINTTLTSKADLSGGKLLTSQLPDLAITDFLGATASQAAMLALTGQNGDWTTRTDDGKVYVIIGTPTTNIASWQALGYPNAPVLDNFSYADAYNAA